MGTYGTQTITYSAYQSPVPGDRTGQITSSIPRLTGTCDVVMGVDIYTAWEAYTKVTVTSSTGTYPAAPSISFYLTLSSDFPDRGLINIGQVQWAESAGVPPCQDSGAIQLYTYVADLVISDLTQTAQDPSGSAVATVEKGVGWWYRRFRTLAGAAGNLTASKQIWPK